MNFKYHKIFWLEMPLSHLYDNIYDYDFQNENFQQKHDIITIKPNSYYKSQLVFLIIFCRNRVVMMFYGEKF